MPQLLSLAFWSGLEEKVGWVLKSSGNFLSNKHKNIIILWRNDWEKWGKRCLPPLKCEKPRKYLYFDKNVSFASKTLLTSRIHPKTWEAQIIKWIISGEPPVDSESQQDSKWGHSWTIHYFTNLLPPCIRYITCWSLQASPRWAAPPGLTRRRWPSTCSPGC